MTWEEFEREIDELASRLQHAPDLIVGIARGGIVPAVMLAKKLDVQDVFTIRVRKEGESRRILGDVGVEIVGKNMLLVEDMLETGKSLAVAKRYFEERGAQVKTACLYTMPQTEIVPDFALRQTPTLAIFPWE
jgi:hypoxanthine phosphoribosyltransferase